MISASDANQTSIPMMMLASGEENREEVEAYSKGLMKRGVGKEMESHVEIFGEMIHGWMSARGNLEEEKVKEQWIKGYKLVGTWFGRFIDR